MLTALYTQSFLPLLVALTALAGLWRAKTPFLAGLLILAGVALTELTKAGPATKFLYLEVGVLAADLLLLVGLAVLAVRTGHWWLIWAAAFQVIATSGHIAKLVVPGFSRMAYALMEGASSYPLLIAMAVGIWQHHSCLRRARDISHEF